MQAKWENEAEEKGGAEKRKEKPFDIGEDPEQILGFRQRKALD